MTQSNKKPGLAYPLLFILAAIALTALIVLMPWAPTGWRAIEQQARKDLQSAPFLQSAPSDSIAGPGELSDAPGGKAPATGAEDSPASSTSPTLASAAISTSSSRNSAATSESVSGQFATHLRNVYSPPGGFKPSTTLRADAGFTAYTHLHVFAQGRAIWFNIGVQELAELQIKSPNVKSSRNKTWGEIEKKLMKFFGGSITNSWLRDNSWVDKIMRAAPIPSAVPLVQTHSSFIPPALAPDQSFELNLTGNDHVVVAWLGELKKGSIASPGEAVQRLRNLEVLLDYLFAPLSFPRGELLQEAMTILIHQESLDARATARFAQALKNLFARDDARASETKPIRRRLRASLVHSRLMDEFIQFPIEKALGGNPTTFHYFLNGTAERWWLKANRNRLTQKIEEYTTAIAQGNAAEIQSAYNSLHLASRQTNLLGACERIYATPDQFRETARKDRMADSITLRCALAAWKKAHGHFPETLDALVPEVLDSLPEGVETDGPVPGQNAWRILRNPPRTWLCCIDVQNLREMQTAPTTFGLNDADGETTYSAAAYSPEEKNYRVQVEGWLLE